MRISFEVEHREYADLTHDYISRIKEFAKIAKSLNGGMKLRFVVCKKNSDKVAELTSTELAALIADRDVSVSVSGLDSALAFATDALNGEVRLVRLVNMEIPIALAEALAAEQVYRAFMINAGRKYHK